MSHVRKLLRDLGDLFAELLDAVRILLLGQLLEQRLHRLLFALDLFHAGHRIELLRRSWRDERRSVNSSRARGRNRDGGCRAGFPTGRVPHPRRRRSRSLQQAREERAGLVAADGEAFHAGASKTATQRRRDDPRRWLAGTDAAFRALARQEARLRIEMQGGRISVEVVQDEIERLRGTWKIPTSSEESDLIAELPPKPAPKANITDPLESVRPATDMYDILPADHRAAYDART